jgi:NADP-dependent 3-hydroxy acid dehydrogenase YdfG
MPSPIALITGANGGLGTHVTQAMLATGVTVVGLAPKIKQSDFDHPNFFALPAALDSLDAAKSAVATVISRYKKIDILAHLVGGFAGGQSVATFQRMFQMNVNAAFHILRAVLPPMRQAASGRIVAIGSRAAEDPGPRQPVGPARLNRQPDRVASQRRRKRRNRSRNSRLRKGPLEFLSTALGRDFGS